MHVKEVKEVKVFLTPWMHHKTKILSLMYSIWIALNYHENNYFFV